MKKIIVYIVLVFFLKSCNVLNKTAKDQLSDGYYTQKSAVEKKKVFVDVVEDLVKIYPVNTENSLAKIDTTHYSTFQSEMLSTEKIDFSLKQNNFDVDFLTIPLKFRFAEKGVPSQLNTNISGVVYVGRRTDIYHLKYDTNPIGKSVRNTLHLGYSIGVFAGFGNTFMSPTNTSFRIEQEYDGVVFSKGIAGFVALNNFNIGLTIGFDNLLDGNKKIWIYQNKPWIGIGFGVNLN